MSHRLVIKCRLVPTRIAGLALSLFMFCPSLLSAGDPSSGRPEDPDVMWWNSEGKTYAAAQKKFEERLPQKPLQSLKKVKPDFFPLLSPHHNDFSAGTVAKGDLNCDGKEDLALLTLSQNDPLARLLSIKREPSREELEKAFTQFRNIKYESGVPLWVGLSTSSTWKWEEQSMKTSWLEFGGPIDARAVQSGFGAPAENECWKKECLFLCPDNGSPSVVLHKKRMEWWKEHRCDRFFINSGGQSEPYHLYWDPLEKKLAIFRPCLI